MATIDELRSRSEHIFSELLVTQSRAPKRRRRGRAAVAAAPAAEQFSWFNPNQAVKAAALSFRLAALAASKPEADDGLAAALDHVEEEAKRADPEQIRQGFALFVTHNREGRRLAKPRTVSAAPALFNPPRTRPAPGQAEISIGGESPQLDYWREDALANEHHQHWHEVYPYTGLEPRDFPTWVGQRSREELVAILTAMVPDRDWDRILAQQSQTELAELFARAARDERVFALPPDLYALIFELNDRQGELFFYMHQQMLARYDAELLSHGLERVEPFGPDAWDEAISAGHDPIGLPRFGRREPDRTLDAQDASRLRALADEIEDALANGGLRGADGGTVEIDRTTLGEAVEATSSQLRVLAPDAYAGLHNWGHGFIAGLSGQRPGVMTSTLTAIRDQVFWQWHKFIDDINAKWQESRGPEPFDDAPDVLVRNTLDSGDEAWSSPDIILCRTSDLPGAADLGELGQQLFGRDNWANEFTNSDAGADGTTLITLGELQTSMKSVNFGGEAIQYLTHEPFSYFVRIQNTATEQVDVTVRVFLAPAGEEADRRAWMEMDKFVVTVPACARVVAARSDTQSSIVKRPVDPSPAKVLQGDGDPNDDAYCDCGWPYTLLLPRGNRQGMEYRLLVVCTDAAIDRVPAPGHCGSMSYCGAVERYPDTRDMGYPFHRPLAGPPTSAIRDTIVQLPNAAARTVVIRHV